jgi:hypothetical protein
VAPPGFDFEASRETIGRLRKLDPRTICFSQFGQRQDASFVIEEAERQLDGYHHFILSRLEQGLDTRQIVEDVADFYLGGVLKADSPERGEYDQFVRSMLMSIVVGYTTYFERSGQLS